MLSVVGSRYAKALLDVVTAPSTTVDPNKALEEMKLVSQTIHESAALHNALLSPAVSPSRKRAVMARLLQPAGVSKQVQNFLFVVIDHRRIHELPSMVEAFDILLDERLGFVRADVSSALPLDDAQRTKLESELSQLAGKKAKVKFSTNPALVGGVVARLGGVVYDGSVRGQLERLKVKLGSG